MATNRPLVARITKLFNLLDQNGDGTLDAKELKFFVRKVVLDGQEDRVRSRQLAKKLLETLDQDGDRSIDVLEFVEGLAGMDEFTGAPLDEFVDAALETAEKHLKAYDAKIDELSLRVFSHLDTDGSKTLGTPASHSRQ
jgi:Ca2+-binding EF-hand superfamily protein